MVSRLSVASLSAPIASVSATVSEKQPCPCRAWVSSNAIAWSKPFRRELQRLTKEEGVYSGPIDGKFGPKTKRAIEALASK